MKPKITVLVQLDAILDTRISTISKHNPEAACELMRNDMYWFRSVDDFTAVGGPDRLKFLEMYGKRDASILPYTLMTTIPYMVRDFLVKTEIEGENTPRVGEVYAELNIWPYDLHDEEKEDLIKVMRVYGGLNTVPKIVSIPPEELTMQRIKENYSAIFMYDFPQWLAIHQTKLRSMYLHDVMFVVPMISSGERMDPTEARESELRPDYDEFELIAAVLREFFVVRYEPAALFSLHRNDMVAAITKDAALRASSARKPA